MKVGAGIQIGSISGSCCIRSASNPHSDWCWRVLLTFKISRELERTVPWTAAENVREADWAVGQSAFLPHQVNSCFASLDLGFYYASAKETDAHWKQKLAEWRSSSGNESSFYGEKTRFLESLCLRNTSRHPSEIETVACHCTVEHHQQWCV